ncbi:hypothetical protein PoB_000796100 [Plakobranchus ocellatus]|uniref:Uncharacterized protein n=1 Tax=Plakobranchus ocellatus TaxID=259542 RepID=A0AAV3Y2N4_9GAST|nr:hypothetical protein PoB_000796100 [Plakobranchus ocellatus]
MIASCRPQLKDIQPTRPGGIVVRVRDGHRQTGAMGLGLVLEPAMERVPAAVRAGALAVIPPPLSAVRKELERVYYYSRLLSSEITDLPILSHHE